MLRGAKVTAPVGESVGYVRSWEYYLGDAGLVRNPLDDCRS